MATETEKTEIDILRILRSRYEKMGYTFVAHPAGDLIPEFLPRLPTRCTRHFRTRLHCN